MISFDSLHTRRHTHTDTHLQRGRNSNLHTKLYHGHGQIVQNDASDVKSKHAEKWNNKSRRERERENAARSKEYMNNNNNKYSFNNNLKHTYRVYHPHRYSNPRETSPNVANIDICIREYLVLFWHSYLKENKHTNKRSACVLNSYA